MVTGSVISFRKHFWTSSFPIEAQLYNCEGCEGVCTHTSKIIHSQDELREFHDELTRLEREREWIFIAYYELPTFA